jgi:hypothetical protein
MATKAPAKSAPAAPVKGGNAITRKRRNTLERKCLSKALKMQFTGASSSVMRLVLAAWKESRRKPAMTRD